MRKEIGIGQEREPKLNKPLIVFRGFSQENIHELNLTELTRFVQLAHEVNSIVSSFPTHSFPELTQTKLIFPYDQEPTIIHNSCVAYKYHPYGGMNSIEIQEGEEVGGKKQIKLSFNGNTTSGCTVTVVTPRDDLRGGLKELISMGREAGGESELSMHGVNHPTKPYYPDFLPAKR